MTDVDVVREGESGTRDSESAAGMQSGRRRGWGKLLRDVRELAEELAHRPNLGLQTPPVRELERLAEIGLMRAPLPTRLGGLGLGLEAGTHGLLLRVLAAVGGADLVLGRFFEGHVNGLLLAARYGTAEQMDRLAGDVCERGMLSGVWNTGTPERMRLLPQADGSFRFEGGKTFATGAAVVQRPVVTAEIPGRGLQMTVTKMERTAHTIDRSFWHPLGMESSESFGVEFTGGRVEASDLIGAPGDFYRDPMFRGGAVRFAAVQAGAVQRLHGMFAEWLEAQRQGEDPYQLLRLGETAVAAQEAAMWVERAGEVSERCLYSEDRVRSERMVEFANMMRTAVERLGRTVMERVTAGVGAHGLLQPVRFERVLRDLTMYLRQPAPDAAVAAVGRQALGKLYRRDGGALDGFWADHAEEQSLPKRYFEHIYSRKRDPWEFETSEYERGKYAATLEALPRDRYRNGVEVGCSIGVLTRELAGRCECLLGLDVSERALEEARRRCVEHAWVRFARMKVPDELPEGQFDLVMVSEVAYYWSRRDLERAADGLAGRQSAGGTLVLVHLTERVPDYPQTGDAVHEYWLARPEWRRVGGGRHPRYRIDVLERQGDESVFPDAV